MKEQGEYFLSSKVLLLSLTLKSFFSLEFNDLASSGKHLKPLLPSCFLLIHDLSRYFDAGFIQVFKESIFFKIWSVWFLKYTLSVEHLSVA